MNFTISELEIIYQYAAQTKAETLRGLKEIIPAIREPLTKAVVENTVMKLQKIPEPECSRFISDTKAHFLEKRDKSILWRLEKAKKHTRVPRLQGHDLSGMERFLPETRHMVILDVLDNSSPVGYKGERYRFFLSDEGYKNARKSEERGKIRICSHAAVASGHIRPDREPGRDI